MVGLYSGDPIDSPGVDALGTNAIPATTGQVIGAAATEAFEGGPTPRLLRQAERVGAPDIPVPADPRIPPSLFGDPTTTAVSAPPPEPPKISADEANDRFGIKGTSPDTSLTFKAPITEQAAADLYKHQRAENLRMDTLARAQPGILTSAPAQVVYGLAGGVMDPSNLAMALIPGIGEANEARIVAATGGGIVGRTLARGVAGAVAGAGQMAALEPLNYGLDQAEGKQWSMGDAVRNIAWGSVLGGGLHVAGGTIRDALGRTVPTDPNPAAVDRLPTEAQQQLVRGAVAQAMDDRPVDLQPAFDLFQAKGADRTEPTPEEDAAPALEEIGQKPSETAASEQVSAPEEITPPKGIDTTDTLAPPIAADLSPLYDNAREPERLTSYVKRQGGVQDVSGDVRTMLGDTRARPGLINQNGVPLDEMTERAWEAGYFPEHGEQRPMINDLLNALDDDYNGFQPRYSDAEQDKVDRFYAARQMNDTIDRLSDTYGIPTKGITRAEFFARAEAAASRDLVTGARGYTLEETFDHQAAEKAAAEQTPAKPSDALAKVQAHIADIEASMFPERAKAEAEAEPGAEPAKPETPADPEIQAAQNLVDAAEKRGAGLDAIAACPGVIGT